MNYRRQRLFPDTESEAKSVHSRHQESTDEMNRQNPCKKQRKSSSTGKQRGVLSSYSTIEECPQVRLSVEDMEKDPAELFPQLQQKFESFGAVKLVVPDSWKPPLTFRYVSRGITTRIQKLNQLSMGKPFEQKIQAYGLKQFEQFALNFQKKYVYKTTGNDSNPTDRDENEFWSLVTKPQYKDLKIEVEYAADLPSSKYGSGFPTTTQTGYHDGNFNYYTSPYNLNNIYKSQDSLLRIINPKNQGISGVSLPWVYIGMKFSSFCWHVEDLYINSLNYNHKGSSKIWYVVPASEKQKFDEFIKKKYSSQMSSKPDFMHRIILMIDPLDVKAAGIKVYKIVQKPRCFVFTFPKVYHAGFSTGFNMGEAVNYVSHRNLPTIKQAYSQYVKLNGKKAAIFPLEWLIHENYSRMESLKGSTAQKETIRKEYERIVAIQHNWVKKIVESVDAYQFMSEKALKYDKNVCSVCKSYCYLSHLKCKKCSKVFCQEHSDSDCCTQLTLVIRKPEGPRQTLLELLKDLPERT